MSLTENLRFFSHACVAVTICLVGLGNSLLRADVRLHNVFGNHMVLQRDRPLRVWGWADAGENVTVRFAGQSVSGVADRQGAWSVLLAPMEASTLPRELSVTGKNVLTITDILVGDVWLCSGQSNMAFGLGGCDAEADIKAADMPMVRYRAYFECFAPKPQADVSAAPWHRVTPASAAGCSGVAFYFGRKVNRESGVPIGLLESTVGGTEIECWMPPEAFRDYPACADIGERLKEAVEQYRRSLPAAVEAVEQWLPSAKKALAEKKEFPMPPRIPLHPNIDRGGHWVRIQSLYNGMIHPLTPLAIKGAIWYQGESNGGEGDSYFQKKRAMIETWRRLWGSDFPFYFVQLANWREPNDDPSGGGQEWQYLRMAQLKCLELPKTGMAVAVDVGDASDIHPKNKQDVGERLALWALAKDYGEKELVHSGPLYRRMSVEEDRIRIHFDHVGTGLMVGVKEGRHPAIEAKSPKLARFAIAGRDQQWDWADAIIDGDTVIVSSPKVREPVAVRYAFSMNPEGCNLYNKEGLPASPFRTDSW